MAEKQGLQSPNGHKKPGKSLKNKKNLKKIEKIDIFLKKKLTSDKMYFTFYKT
jgi:hypothetical protein